MLKKENLCRVAYCGKVALPGHSRVVLAGLFVPLGESEKNNCSVERQVYYTCSEKKKYMLSSLVAMAQ